MKTKTSKIKATSKPAKKDIKRIGQLFGKSVAAEAAKAAGVKPSAPTKAIKSIKA